MSDRSTWYARIRVRSCSFSSRRSDCVHMRVSTVSRSLCSLILRYVFSKSRLARIEIESLYGLNALMLACSCGVYWAPSNCEGGSWGFQSNNNYELSTLLSSISSGTSLIHRECSASFCTHLIALKILEYLNTSYASACSSPSATVKISVQTSNITSSFSLINRIWLRSTLMIQHGRGLVWS